MRLVPGQIGMTEIEIARRDIDAYRADNRVVTVIVSRSGCSCRQ